MFNSRREALMQGPFPVEHLNEYAEKTVLGHLAVNHFGGLGCIVWFQQSGFGGL
jgi:hypothetical protein